NYNTKKTMHEGNITIRVKDNESVERALKRFKKKFERLGILKRVRSQMSYKKPSTKRRVERLKAIYRNEVLANIAQAL
ncbi:MAG: 30S ribosomal protein S21, partial [Bacteroidota bacterium]